MKTLIRIFFWLAFFLAMEAMTNYANSQVPTLDSSFEQPEIPAYTADLSLSVKDVHKKLDADTSSYLNAPGRRDFAKGMAFAYRHMSIDNPMAADYFKAACTAYSPDWSRPHPSYLIFWMDADGRLENERKWVDYLDATCPFYGELTHKMLDAVDNLIEHWYDTESDLLRE